MQAFSLCFLATVLWVALLQYPPPLSWWTGPLSCEPKEIIHSFPQLCVTGEKLTISDKWPETNSLRGKMVDFESPSIDQQQSRVCPIMTRKTQQHTGKAQSRKRKSGGGSEQDVRPSMTHFLQKGLTSQRYSSHHQRCHLGTKCSETWAYGRRFTFKPQVRTAPSRVCSQWHNFVSAGPTP